MQPLTEEQIRSSFVNATAAEVERMALPGLHETVWETREYLGWRDPLSPLRGYIVFWRDGAPVGMVVRASEPRGARGRAAMCSLCRTHQPGNQVSLFSFARAGAAGRNGNTVATYICADLGCSTIIRIVPPASDLQPSPDDVVDSRGSGLLARLNNFTGEVLRPA